MHAAVSVVDKIRGPTERRTAPDGQYSWVTDEIMFDNQLIGELAMIFEQTGLGTQEEGYLCIISAFDASEKQLLPTEITESREPSLTYT